MKKILTLVLLGLSFFSLVGCSSKSSTNQEASIASSSQEQIGDVTLIIRFDDGEEKEFKNQPITADTTVLDLLRSCVEVKDDKGFITEIDNVKQDTSAKKYWMYEINDQMATKGAGEQKLKDRDKIIFELGGF
ncbi:DUF4430 domain-containing protein [Streptococcaceae bacterium ESL0729]|nr:DUF4430 domain-containing protein [Streptococcaceae bacterium ESL0729]